MMQLKLFGKARRRNTETVLEVRSILLKNFIGKSDYHIARWMEEVLRRPPMCNTDEHSAWQYESIICAPFRITAARVRLYQ
jgi:hypothetical protein